MRLAVGVVSNRDWKPKFGVSLISLFNHVMLNGINGERIDAIGFLPRVNSSLVPKGRRLVLESAIAEGFTHCLCIDDDMVFPPDTLDYLASHDAPMTAANYCSKSTSDPVAIGTDKQFCYSAGKSGGERVNRVGFGLVLLDLSVVASMPKPWFAVPWVERAQAELGEDYFFCMKWRDAGHEIVVDHDLSHRVTHLAEIELATP